MIQKENLLRVADAYKLATGIVADVTVSNRVFDDGKKLAALRGDADITLGRFNAAMKWFAANWPDGQGLPEELSPYTIFHEAVSLPSNTVGDAA